MAEHSRQVIVLFVMLIASSLLFLFWQIQEPVQFILMLRVKKLAALICVGASTGASTVLFQTIAMNRLLTPGIVGFDALFVLLQTLLIALLGRAALSQIDGWFRFSLEAGVLMLAAIALFGLLLRRGAQDVTRMILTGIILGIMLRGLAEMVQRILDPSEFTMIQQALFANFSSVETEQLLFSLLVLSLSVIVAISFSSRLDVAGLGRNAARSLGLAYDKVILICLILIALMVSISMALVGPFTIGGPIAFLGLIAATLIRFLTKTYKHKVLILGAALMGALILVVGQFVFEHVFSSQSTLPVVIDFFGGLLFLYLVLRRRYH